VNTDTALFSLDNYSHEVRRRQGLGFQTRTLLHIL